MKLSRALSGVSLIAVAAACLVAAPSLARAQSCSSNSDCQAGMTCQQLPTPSAKPGCSGPDCPTVDPGVVAPDVVTKACAPAPCQVDADCGGGGRICQHDKITVCSGGTAPACAPNQACESQPKTETTCVESVVSACTYKWQLPCNVDADCGDGFTCAPTVSGMCSGSGPTAAGGSGTAGAGGASGSAVATDPAIPIVARPDGGVSSDGPTCTTTESFPGYCRAKATTCATDADCPAAWSCTTGAVPSGNATDTPGSTGSGSGSVSSPVGQPEGAPADLVATIKSCQPPTAFPLRAGNGTDTGGSKQNPTGAPGAAESAHSSNSGCTVAGPGSVAALAGWAGLSVGLALALVARRSRRRR